MHEKMKKIILVGFVFVLSCGITHTCLAVSPGTTGATFLKIGPGARAVGMGEVFVAIADDATALFWNPAGIVQISRPQIVFMHSLWFQGVNYDYLAYVQSLPGPGNEKFGVSATFLHSGDMVRTTEDASGNYTGAAGIFVTTDLALGLSYAWEVSRKHSLGASLKLIRSTIDDAVGYGLCVDFGYLLRLIPDLSIGLNLQNGLVSMPIRFYRELESISASNSLPVNFKAGIAYKYMEGRLLLGLDVNFPIDSVVNYHAGAEYKFTDNLSLRAGYKTDLIQDIDLLSGLCTGVGYKFSSYELDYAFVPYGNLGVTHRISLLMKF